jgi:ABC-2 type transport system ATP-binding protein
VNDEIALRVEGLTKRYGSLIAVKGLTLSVRRGEVFGLLGPNGAGKTTSINMMCGLLQPDAGRVLIAGMPIASRLEEVRVRVGVCPQEIVLWKQLTCLEQLQFVGEMYGLSGREARRRADSLLADLGLRDKRDQLARTLSGGMQRRLNLILALVHDPDILVLDEPEAGLDPQGRVLVRDYIRALARQKTIILTTHNMDEADRVADRVAIIDHGELLALDAPEALKRSTGEGDVIEIALVGQPDGGEKARAALAHLAGQATLSVTEKMMTVRALKAGTLLPAILDALARNEVSCGDVRLRENTLEDVFIRLTGRSLRE